MTTRACAQCDSGFEPRQGGRPQKYCSTACVRRVEALARRLPKRTACAECSKPLRAKTARTILCSTRCAKARYRKTPDAKQRARQYAASYDRKHKDHLRAKARVRYVSSIATRQKAHALAARWRKENPERKRQLAREYGARNRDRINTRSRAGYAKNREQLRERASAWRSENREKDRTHKRRWGRDNPEARRANWHRYRSRSKSAPGSFTVEQMRARFAFFGDRCAYCGSTEKLTIDHVIPLSRGGTNWPSNLRPACRSCNSAKRDRVPAEWFAMRKVT